MIPTKISKKYASSEPVSVISKEEQLELSLSIEEIEDKKMEEELRVPLLI